MRNIPAVVALLFVGALFIPPFAGAQEAPRRAPESSLWFDPTQLPSFTGTVERYLLNPRGEVDRLVFREGPQVVFPPDLADALRQAAPPGRPVVVWGIRSRHAPVITLLAFAPSAEEPPVVAERLYWRLPRRGAADKARQLQVEGTVRAPYYTPQGEVTGAILEDGAVVLLPSGAAEPFRSLLRQGAAIVAQGPGVATEAGRALLADRLGENATSLREVTEPAPQPGARTPG